MSKLKGSINLARDFIRRRLQPHEVADECVRLIERGADTETVLKAAMGFAFGMGTKAADFHQTDTTLN